MVVIVLAGAAWTWWRSPERRIRALLDDVAAAFTHDEPGSGLEALAAAAALQRHLAPDVRIEPAGGAPITGRDAAVTAAARYRAAGAATRVRFFDPRIGVEGDSSASLTVTAEVTRRTASGEDLVDVHQVAATLISEDNRWQVSSARSVRGGEPLP